MWNMKGVICRCHGELLLHSAIPFSAKEHFTNFQLSVLVLCNFIVLDQTHSELEVGHYSLVRSTFYSMAYRDFFLRTAPSHKLPDLFSALNKALNKLHYTVGTMWLSPVPILASLLISTWITMTTM